MICMVCGSLIHSRLESTNQKGAEHWRWSLQRAKEYEEGDGEALCISLCPVWWDHNRRPWLQAQWPSQHSMEEGRAAMMNAFHLLLRRAQMWQEMARVSVGKGVVAGSRWEHDTKRPCTEVVSVENGCAPDTPQLQRAGSLHGSQRWGKETLNWPRWSEWTGPRFPSPSRNGPPTSSIMFTSGEKSRSKSHFLHI